MSIDTDLLQRYQIQGDKDALNELLGRHYPNVFQVALRLVHNEFDARDVAQTVFLKAIRSAHTIRNPKAFRSWLLRITVNEVRGTWRKRKDEPHHDELFESILEMRAPSPPAQASRREFELELERTLESFPPELKTPLVLRYYQALSLADIAAILDLPKSTVQSRVETAVKQLKKRLGASRMPMFAPFLSELGFATSSLGAMSALGAAATGVLAMKLLLVALASVGVWFLVASKQEASMVSHEGVEGSISTAPTQTLTKENAPELAGLDRVNATSHESVPSAHETTHVVTEGPGEIRGVVLSSPSMRPVAGARVHVRFSYHPMNGHLGTEHESACANVYVTGEDGEFTCTDLPEGRAYDLGVIHPKFAYTERRGIGIRTSKRRVDAGAIVVDAPRSLLGVVVDSMGKPVTGARVTAGDHRRFSGYSEPTFSPSQLRGPSVATGSKGEFELPNLTPGYHRVIVKHSEYASRVVGQVYVPAKGRADKLILKLIKAKAFRGRVLSQDGAPLSGVRIIVGISELVDVGARGHSYMAPWSHTETDDDGRYQVVDLPVMSKMMIEIDASKKGYAEAEASYGLGDASTQDLRLVAKQQRAGIPVLARVIDKNGTPIRDIEGRATLDRVQRGERGRHERSRVPLFDEVQVHAELDPATGVFRFEHVPPGMYRLDVNVKGFERYSQPRVDVEPRMEVLKCQVGRGLTVSGQVLDADTGKPISGATVERNKMNFAVENDGHFEVGGLSRSGYTIIDALTVRAPGYFSARPFVRAPKGAQNFELDVKLRSRASGLRLHGHVQNARGEPVIGARVGLKARKGTGQITAYTSRQGRFEFDAIPADTPLKFLDLEIAHPDYALHRSSLGGAKATEALEVVVEEGRRVSGVVRTTNGAPVPHASISVTTARVKESYVRGIRQDQDFADSPMVLQTRADAQGRYSLEHMPAFKCTLLASGSIYRCTVNDGYLGVSIPAGTSDLPNTSLDVERGVVVEGMVVDTSGEAIPSITIDTSCAYSGTETDASGHFKTEPLFGPQVELTLRSKSYFGRLPRAETYHEPVRIVATPCGEVRGRITTAKGKPLNGQKLTITDASGNEHKTTSFQYGKFEFHRVPTGPVSIVVPGYEHAETVVGVTKGATTDAGTITAKKP